MSGRRLQPKQIQQIRSLAKGGATLREIARKTSVSHTTVARVVREHAAERALRARLGETTTPTSSTSATHNDDDAARLERLRDQLEVTLASSEIVPSDRARCSAELRQVIREIRRLRVEAEMPDLEDHKAIADRVRARLERQRDELAKVAADA